MRRKKTLSACHKNIYSEVLFGQIPTTSARLQTVLCRRKNQKIILAAKKIKSIVLTLKNKVLESFREDTYWKRKKNQIKRNPVLISEPRVT